MATQAMAGNFLIPHMLAALGISPQAGDPAERLVLWIPLQGPVVLEVTTATKISVFALTATPMAPWVGDLLAAVGFPPGSEVRDLKLTIAMGAAVTVVVERFPSPVELARALVVLARGRAQVMSEQRR